MDQSRTLVVAVLAAVLFFQDGNAQPADIDKLLLSYHKDERVELLIYVRPVLEPVAPETMPLVTYQVQLVGNPYVVNLAQTRSPVNGIGRFNVRVGTIEYGTASLIVNDGNGDQEFCCVEVKGNRLVHEVEVSYFLTSEETSSVPLSGTVATTLAAPDGSTRLVEVSVFNRFVFDGDVNPSSTPSALISHSDLEGVELTLDPDPAGQAPAGTEFIFTASVFDKDGQFVGSSAVPAIVGEATCMIFHVDSSSVLRANDVPLGAINLVGGRTAYRIEGSWSRMGRNPRTGETIQIATTKKQTWHATVYDLASKESRSNVPGFRAGKALKDAVN